MAKPVRSRVLAAAALAIALVVAIGGERISLYRARDSRAHAQIAELQEALRRYYLDNGSYPTTDQGLEALVGDYIKGGPSGIDPGMVYPRLPPPGSGPLLDPWRHPYSYESDGQNYELKSFGPDSLLGGSSEDAAVVASSPEKPPG
jgi:general secretion pathway protein G